ncbi:hypothetical protein MSAN_00072800 [Mycena sanguinolenta]|uniref:Arrestin-like N-terminal domain-containing protein n=1 Tax=Mycena sanguinolenta TaxID=230812 RepID=A0A8H6ZJA7_9AGAR|nr:hypothetical protein MSAN_00072800 [Mycena sanguinolenta]
MTELAPPSYDGFGDEALINSSHAALSDLPVYTRRPTPPPAAQVNREPKEFTYEIKNRGGTPWATLTVHGDPRLTKAIPTIMEGSNLVGSVKLALRSAEAIQAICVLIKGEVMQGGPAAVPLVFLESKHTLWSAADGDPQAPENLGKSVLKLQGDYHWPFSIALPTTLTKDSETYRLPHTFLDRLASFSVRYVAEMRIVRGKLRPDDKLTCKFGYFSMAQPGPPSALRQLAYQENSPLFGPESDPSGWESQSSSLKGIVFSSRAIEVKFTFSLAKPLSYTRSASIPCALTIETNDRQALDLLSSPSASMVYLERGFYEKKDIFRNTIEPCGQAVFWPSTEGAPEESSYRRRLMGEIHLRANLQPSSAVCGFQVEYAVVVFPFQAAAFKPIGVDNAPLLRQAVEITTRYAPGPRQKTYTPPTYEARNSIVDYYYYALVIENAQKSGRSKLKFLSHQRFGYADIGLNRDKGGRARGGRGSLLQSGFM